jgi:hypothetical protein
VIVGFKTPLRTSCTSFNLRCIFLLAFLSLKAYGFLNTSPLYGSAYVLHCIEPAVSPYFYVARTENYQLANGATIGSPGIYMSQQPPNTCTPYTMWTFDHQDDATFLIYMTDSNLLSYQRLLGPVLCKYQANSLNLAIPHQNSVFPKILIIY